jgi:hypothetical protein
MADKKISQLTAATTPLAGTEVAPIVQSSSTVKATVDSFTAGRAITPLSVTQNGRSTPYSLLNNGIPFILPSSGTMGNDGALSGITAVPTGIVYSHSYMYFPANAISAGSAAGWYYAQLSSTTAATVYNNVYTSGVPTVPSSPTAFVTTGPGAYTQTSASDIASVSIPLSANIIGVNGSIDADCGISATNNANQKIFRAAIDSTASQFGAFTSISVPNPFLRMRSSLIAAGVTNRQLGCIGMSPSASTLGSSTAPNGQGTQLTLDMTTTHNLIFYIRNVTATDTSAFCSMQVMVTA